MAKLALEEQHLDRQLPIVVIQITTWWETALVLVKLQEIGLEVNLPVNVIVVTQVSVATTHKVKLHPKIGTP